MIEIDGCPEFQIVRVQDKIVKVSNIYWAEFMHFLMFQLGVITPHN